MTDFDDRERAAEPEDLGRLFLEPANARDVDGVAALYEPDAVLACAGGDLVTGAKAIRRMYEALLADPPQFRRRRTPRAASRRSRSHLNPVPRRRHSRDGETATF